jgi:PAS domain S-box-containing protein
MNEDLINVLLVEDNPGDVRLVETILLLSKHNEFKVESVERLTSAIQRLETEPFDVVLLDLSLPDSHGLESFDRLNSLFPETPIIVLSGLDDEEIALEAVRKGAQDYIVKGDSVRNILVRSIYYSIERKRLEQSLREREKQLEIALEGGKAYTWALNLNTGKIAFPEKISHALGYENASVANDVERVSKLIHPDDSEKVRKDLNDYLEGKTSIYETECRLRKKDGDWIWILSRGRAVEWDKDGNPTRLLGTNFDITERKRMEGRLRTLQRAVEQSPSVVVITGIDGCIEYINPKFSGLTGYSEDEAMGENPRILKSGEHSAKFYEELWETITAGDEWRGEFRNRRKNGELYWESASISPVKDAQGNIKHFIKLSEDITEKKKTQQKLRESEEKFRKLFEDAPLGISLVNENGVVLDVNKKMLDLVGYTKKEFIKKDVLELIYPDFVEKKKKLIDKLFRGDIDFFQFEEKRLKKNGDPIWLRVTSTLFQVETSDERVRLDMFEDITERKTVEEAMAWETRVKSAVAELSKALLASATIKEISKIVLEQAKKITGSKFGYVGYIDPETGYLICPTMTEDIWEMCHVEGKDVVFEEFGGLWGWVLDHKTSILTNDLAVDKRSTGAPEGHIPIYNFLSVPALIGESLVGQVALANSSGEYTERDLNAVQQLTDIFSLAVQRRRAEAALSESEEKFRALVENTSDIIMRFDKQFRHLYVNPAVKNILDMTPENFIGKTHRDLGFPAEQCNHWEEKMEQVFESGEPHREIVELETPAGNVVLDWQILPEFGAQGEIETLLSTSRDISQLRKAQRRIRESEELYRKLISASPDAITVTDGTGEITLVSPKTVELFGYEEMGEIIGKEILDLLSPDYHEKARGKMENVFSENKVISCQCEFLRNDGSTFIGEMNSAGLFDHHNKPVGMVSITRDITLQKEAEAHLQRAKEAAEEANRAKSEFLANMSHELRTPLNAILGKTESLQELIFGCLTEKQKDALKTIQKSSYHLLSLINDILDLAKIEADKLEVYINKVNLNQVCQASIKMVRQRAYKKNIQIYTDIEDNYNYVYADERRLKQILVNLLSNAVKFTPEGGKVGLDVSFDEERNWVYFRVWDTGIGISEGDIKSLFKPFTQVDSGLTRAQSGTGLGLSLVKNLVKMHNGEVDVESSPTGSTFTAKIPWKIDYNEQTNGLNNTEDKAEKMTKKYDILLAEDNEDNIDTLRDYLEAKGLSVTVARNGIEVLEMLKEETPDLILMDIHMPEMDGLEAIARIRENEATQDIPIFALTALAMQGDKEKAFDAGADDYISKPVSLKKLTQKIKDYLDGLKQ